MKPSFRIEEIHYLEQLRVLAALDARYLLVHFFDQYEQLALERSAFQVRIETYKDHLAAVYAHNVMIARFLILLVVAPVRKLIALDRQQRAVDVLSAVDPPAHRAVTVAGFQLLIMSKAFELLVNRLPHRQLLRVLVVQLAARVIGEEVLKACGAVAVVFSLSTPRVRPRLAVRTNLTSTALGTLVF